jgi:hypothetical protein
MISTLSSICACAIVYCHAVCGQTEPAAIIHEVQLDAERHTRQVSINTGATPPYVMVACRGGQVDVFLLADPPRSVRLSVERSESLFPPGVTCVSSLNGEPLIMFGDTQGGTVRMDVGNPNAAIASRFPRVQAFTKTLWDSLRPGGSPEATPEFSRLQPLSITSCTIGDLGTQFCVGYADGSIDVRDWKTGAQLHSVDGFIEARQLDVPPEIVEFAADVNEARSGGIWWLGDATAERDVEVVQVINATSLKRLPNRTVVGLFEAIHAVVVAEQDRVFAYDLQQKEELWSHALGFVTTASRATRVYACSSTDMEVFEIAPGTGNFIWRKRLVPLPGVENHSIAVSMSDDGERLAAMLSPTVVVVYDTKTGEIIWNSADALPAASGSTTRFVDAELSRTGETLVIVNEGEAIYEVGVGPR